MIRSRRSSFGENRMRRSRRDSFRVKENSFRRRSISKRFGEGWNPYYGDPPIACYEDEVKVFFTNKNGEDDWFVVEPHSDCFIDEDFFEELYSEIDTDYVPVDFEFNYSFYEFDKEMKRKRAEGKPHITKIETGRCSGYYYDVEEEYYYT